MPNPFDQSKFEDEQGDRRIAITPTKHDYVYVIRSTTTPLVWSWLLSRVGHPTDSTIPVIKLIDGSELVTQLAERMVSNELPAIRQPFTQDLNEYL